VAPLPRAISGSARPRPGVGAAYLCRRVPAQRRFAVLAVTVFR
jgi:hypothetical protein